MRRQAVLLIHGIGEQRPMDTLRSFVDAAWVRATDIHKAFAAKNAGAIIWSKPDTISESFELRKLTTTQNIAGIRTDFFEFYWQHLLQGTTYGHVLAWLKTLLLRRPSTVPAQLRTVYWLLWAVSIAAIALALYATASAAADQAPLISPWLSAVTSVALLPAIGFIIRSIVGDAARYLHVAPANVQCRHAIREAGISLLTNLHQREYERILIVGHSLGSVIGFDILTHAWPRYHRLVSVSATPTVVGLDALEAFAQEKAEVATIQARQRAYFNELMANGNPWRVTDFITLGSPLAHAAILLAHDKTDLRSKQHQREVPTCLPTPELLKRGHQLVSRFSFELGTGTHAQHRVPHHAAVFAPTRWTNLYFPSRKLVVGDLIGGPLHDVMGLGIRDVEVTTTLRRGLFSHTLYWKMPADLQSAPTEHLGNQTQAIAPKEAPPHIIALREALDLVDRKNPLGGMQ